MRPICCWVIPTADGHRGSATRPARPTPASCKEYPLSPFVDEAKATNFDGDGDSRSRSRRLQPHEVRVGESGKGRADEPGIRSTEAWPRCSEAAKSGEPAMTSLRPTIPVSVPVPSDAGAGFSGDVTATTIQDSTTLDTKPDARGPQPAATSEAGQPAQGANSTATGTDVTGSVGPRPARPQEEPLPMLTATAPPSRNKASSRTTRRIRRKRTRNRRRNDADPSRR